MELKNLTVITLNQPDITDFAAVRNSELLKAQTEWVLFVDQDEVVTKELEHEIAFAIASHKFAAYYLKRLDIFMDQKLRHGETGHAKFIRLARRDFGRWVRPVHEQWVGDGRVGELDSPLLHYSHNSLSTFLDKINNYSTLEAEYRFKQGIKSSLLKIAIYPLAKLKLNYLLRLGFLDGVPGLIMAMMMSFHSYLTWTKLYLLGRAKS